MINDQPWNEHIQKIYLHEQFMFFIIFVVLKYYKCLFILLSYNWLIDKCVFYINIHSNIKSQRLSDELMTIYKKKGL